MRTVVMIIGVLAAAVAAEGLSRVANFISVFNGNDAPFYYAILIFMLFLAVVFVLAAVGRAGNLLKYGALIGLGISIFVMMQAPAFGANVQALGAMLVCVICVLFVKRTPEDVAAE